MIINCRYLKDILITEFIIRLSGLLKLQNIPILHKNCLSLLQKVAALRFGLKQYLMRKMCHGNSRLHHASNDGKLLHAVNYNDHRKGICR